MSIESIKVRDLNTASSIDQNDLLLVAKTDGTTQNAKISALPLSAMQKITSGYFSLNTTHSVDINPNRNVLLTMGFKGGQGGRVYVYGEFQYNLASSQTIGAAGSGDIFTDGVIDYQVYFSPTNQYFLTGSATTNKLNFRCNETALAAQHGSTGHYGVPTGENFWVTAFYV